MTLELLLDDAPGPAPLALAVELGWVSLPAPTRTVAGLNAALARERPEALALLPVAEYAELQESHIILPALAAGGQHGAATVLVSDRPLEEVEGPLVDLDGVSRTAEMFARATLAKFYGITGAGWLRERAAGPAGGGDEAEMMVAVADDGGEAAPAPGAPPAERPTLLVREGGEALHLLDEPGGAVVADFGRAWFILTGLPAVSHLLLARRDLLDREEERSRVQGLIDALPAALDTVRQRRRELRRTLSDRYGVSRDLLNDFYNDQFLTLTGDAQRATLTLFERGAWGMGLPTVARLGLAPGAAHV